MNEIQTYDKINDRDGLEMLGAAIQRSGMFGAETKEQGIILALQCMVEKKPPLEMAKNYHIIQGKLSKRADAMLADFRKAGGKFIFADLKNPTIQQAKVTFEDYKDFAVEYSIDDAKTAGVYNAKGAWVKYPGAMLRARLVSETLRAIAPEIVTGVYTPEELETPISAKPELKRAQPVEAMPEPKKTPENAIEAEVCDSDLDVELAKLIGDDEKIVNLYWEKKGLIDGLDTTWRDLNDDTKRKMIDQFEQFMDAAKRKATQ